MTNEQELAQALADAEPFITLISHIVLSGAVAGPQVRRVAGAVGVGSMHGRRC